MEPVTAAAETMLCCPLCRGDLERDRSLHCRRCARTWPVVEGIPSFASTDFYWGEIPRPAMQAILEDIRTKGWEEVVHRELPRRYPDRYRYIFHPIRADWFYVGGVRQRQAALDLGAGWGGLSLRLSRLFDKVVAVEGVWERIKFASLLFEQEGVTNVQPIHADIHALLLPRESFDLVVMNGVLEWAALGGDSPDPETAQRNLLSSALQLLRPGGSLYIGIENRFAFIFLMGGRDHERPRWMGVLPRGLARWYGRLRGVPQRHPLTHSPAGYTRLLETAGFEDVRFHTAFPSYSYPRVLIPLSHPAALAWAAKRSSDWRLDSLSLPSKLAHRLAASPFMARLACPRAESLTIWARRPRVGQELKLLPNKCHRSGGPFGFAQDKLRHTRPTAPQEGLAELVLAQLRSRWDELGLRRPVPSRISALQLSGNWEAGGKIGWFIFSDGSPEPAVVAKVSRTTAHGERIANEYQALCDLHAMAGTMALHVPRPLALWKTKGHLVSLQDYVPGRAISRLARRKPSEAAVVGMLRLCVPLLTQLARDTHQGTCRPQEHPYLSPLLDRAALVTQSPDCSAEARELLDSLILIARQADGATLPIVAHHGDLNTFDILCSRAKRSPPDFWVTDWEWYTPDGLPFLDLVTLGILAAESAARNDPGTISAMMCALIGAQPGEGRLPGEDRLPGSSALLPSVREIAAAYCASLALADRIRPPLAAAALLHTFVKGREASYAGTRYVSLSNSNPWVTAGRALLEASRGGEGATPP